MYTSYFMDTENLSADILKHIKYLDKSDKVYLFYSNHSKRMDCDTVKELQNSPCKIEFIKSTLCGCNALDFVMVSFLGDKIGAYKKKINKHTYVLLTNDTGFDSCVAYWQNQHVNVTRKSDFSTNPVIKNKENHYGLDENVFHDVMDTLKKSKTKSDFHAKLMKNENPTIKCNYLSIYKTIRADFCKLKEI